MSGMTVVMMGALGVVALLIVAVVAHFFQSIGDRIAHGPGPTRRTGRDLRAEDTSGYRRDARDSDAAGDAIAAASYDRKRGDGSGLAGL
jgi:hypothetical protein